MINVTVEFNKATLGKKIYLMSKSIKDLRPVWNKFIPLYQDTIDDAFNTQGKIFGERWKSYNPLYRDFKSELGYEGTPTLIKSGALFNATQGGTGSFKKVEAREMEYGIGAPINYAQIHQTGGTINKTTAMRKFFFAKYYEAKEKGREKAQKMFLTLAIGKKTYITIPQRAFFLYKDNKQLPSRALTGLKNIMYKHLTETKQ